MSFSYINAQISSVQSTLHALNQELAEKEEQLRRLKEAQSELSDCQGDFQRNEHLYLEPDLTPKTWWGQKQNEYDNIREGEIKDNYVEVYGIQIANALGKMTEKITEITLKIEQLKASIQSAQSRLSSLYI